MQQQINTMSWTSTEPTIDLFTAYQDGVPTPSLAGTMWTKNWTRTLTNGPAPYTGPDNSNTETWVHPIDPSGPYVNTLKIARQGGAIEWSADVPAVDAIDMSPYSQIIFGKNSFPVSGTLPELTLTDGTGNFFTKAAPASSTEFAWFLFDFVGVDLTDIVSILISNPIGATRGSFFSEGGGEPHIVCIDGSRMEIYEDATYRLFEDRDADLVVNMTVKDAFAHELAVVRPSTGARAAVRFSEDKMSCKPFVHDEAISLQFEEDQVGGTAHFTIDGTGYTVVAQGKYASFGLQQTNWSVGQNVTDIGGALAGVIHTVENLWDVAPGPTVRNLEVGAFEGGSALVCEADIPHIVTFGGNSLFETGDITLLEESADGSIPRVEATLDQYNRIESLRIPKHNFKAVWTRGVFGGEYVKPSVCAISNGAFDVHDDAFGYLDMTFGNLLVRIQPKGAVSFAVRGPLPSDAAGVLIDVDTTAARLAQNSAVSESIYERHVEKHLASEVSQMSKMFSGISCR